MPEKLFGNGLSIGIIIDGKITICRKFVLARSSLPAYAEDGVRRFALQVQSRLSCLSSDSNAKKWNAKK